MADLKNLLTLEQAEKELGAVATALGVEAVQRISHVLEDALARLRTEAEAITDTDLSKLVERASHFFVVDSQASRDDADLEPVQVSLRWCGGRYVDRQQNFFSAPIKLPAGRHRFVFAILPLDDET